MARDELGPVGGVAALVGVMMIMKILIAVLGLVVVNAMKHSPWATSTVAATIPIAILIGLYMRHFRPGRVLEGTLIGIALLLLAVAGGCGACRGRSGSRSVLSPRPWTSPPGCACSHCFCCGFVWCCGCFCFFFCCCVLCF